MANKLSELPLEFRIEYIKSMSNIQHELIKTFYDWRPLDERYLDGSIVIPIHLLASKDCLRVHRIKADESRMLDSRKDFVFVRVGELSDEFRPVASIVRLQPLDDCDVFSSQSLEAPLLIPEVLFRIYNDKLCFLYDTLGLKAGQLIAQVVQGFSQGLYDFPNEPPSPWRCREIDREGGSSNWHNQLFPLDFNKPLLVIQRDVIGYDFGEGLDLRNKGVQVFPCPFNLFISAIERLHMLYSTQEQESGCKRTQTENTQGARNSRTHTGRVRAQSKKGCQARQITSESPEEVASGTSPGPHCGGCIAKHTHLGSLEDA